MHSVDEGSLSDWGLVGGVTLYRDYVDFIGQEASSRISRVACIISDST